jgi:hypothetical protein
MGIKATPEHNFAVFHPKVAKEWHPSKNKFLTPRDVTPGSSSKKVWWKCNKGHEWEGLIKDRSRGSGCPECWNDKRKSRNN